MKSAKIFMTLFMDGPLQQLFSIYRSRRRKDDSTRNLIGEDLPCRVSLDDDVKAIHGHSKGYEDCEK